MARRTSLSYAQARQIPIGLHPPGPATPFGDNTSMRMIFDPTNGEHYTIGDQFLNKDILNDPEIIRRLRERGLDSYMKTPEAVAALSTQGQNEAYRMPGVAAGVGRRSSDQQQLDQLEQDTVYSPATFDERFSGQPSNTFDERFRPVLPKALDEPIRRENMGMKDDLEYRLQMLKGTGSRQPPGKNQMLADAMDEVSASRKARQGPRGAITGQPSSYDEYAHGGSVPRGPDTSYEGTDPMSNPDVATMQPGDPYQYSGEGGRPSVPDIAYMRKFPTDSNIQEFEQLYGPAEPNAPFPPMPRDRLGSDYRFQGKRGNPTDLDTEFARKNPTDAVLEDYVRRYGPINVNPTIGPRSDLAVGRRSRDSRGMVPETGGERSRSRESDLPHGMPSTPDVLAMSDIGGGAGEMDGLSGDPRDIRNFIDSAQGPMVGRPPIDRPYLDRVTEEDRVRAAEDGPSVLPSDYARRALGYPSSSKGTEAELEMVHRSLGNAPGDEGSLAPFTGDVKNDRDVLNRFIDTKNGQDLLKMFTEIHGAENLPPEMQQEEYNAR
jgi:hypothetical protein